MAKRISGAGTTPVRGRWTVTCGCDTDKNYVVVGIFHQENPEIVTREFEQSYPGAQRAIDWMREEGVEMTIIESTANYHMLFYDAMRKSGMRIFVINPILVKALLRVEGKSDKGDAATLARLAASFDLRFSNMPDEQQRMIRLHMRGLDSSKDERTRVTNRTSSTLTGAGVTIFRLIGMTSVSGMKIMHGLAEGVPPKINVEQSVRVTSRSKYTLQDLIDSLPPNGLPAYMRSWLKLAIRDIERLDRSIDEKEKEAYELINELDLAVQITWMSTVPAVSPMLALRIIGEMGQDYWERYHSEHAFAKAVGVVPANQVSGGKIIKRKSSHGNVHVKKHLLNSVKSWVMHADRESELYQFYSTYKSRSTFAKAVSSVANRVCQSLWWCGTRGNVYIEKRDLVHNTPPPHSANIVDTEDKKVADKQPRRCAKRRG